MLGGLFTRGLTPDGITNPRIFLVEMPSHVGAMIRVEIVRPFLHRQILVSINNKDAIVHRDNPQDSDQVAAGTVVLGQVQRHDDALLFKADQVSRCRMHPLYGKRSVEYLKRSCACLMRTPQNHTCDISPTMRGSQVFPERSRIRSEDCGSICSEHWGEKSERCFGSASRGDSALCAAPSKPRSTLGQGNTRKR